MLGYGKVIDGRACDDSGKVIKPGQRVELIIEGNSMFGAKEVEGDVYEDENDRLMVDLGYDECFGSWGQKFPVNSFIGDFTGSAARMRSIKIKEESDEADSGADT